MSEESIGGQHIVSPQGSTQYRLDEKLVEAARCSHGRDNPHSVGRCEGHERYDDDTNIQGQIAKEIELSDELANRRVLHLLRHSDCRGIMGLIFSCPDTEYPYVQLGSDLRQDDNK